MHDLLLGAIAAFTLVAALFFLRYWLSSRDRLFLYFAAAFALEALNRVHMGITETWNEDDLPLHYMIRLASYLLILFGIWQHNRPRR
ncbi:MAG: DUF5985 family protein [Burkholderiales bacterium]